MIRATIVVLSVFAVCLAGVGRLSAADKKQPAPVRALFNGKDLSGWTWISRDKKSKIGDVWTVKDGVLICKGKPIGYIRTDDSYANYRLSLQWRWKPGSKGGNSGVLIHSKKSVRVWPKSIESQLYRGNAGDFWAIGGTTIDVPNAAKRKKGRRHLNLTDDSEKTIGEWNTMVVTCLKNTITVHVNGVLVNRGTNASVSGGHICLQSEGAEIQFRNVMLTKDPTRIEIKKSSADRVPLHEASRFNSSGNSAENRLRGSTSSQPASPAA